MQCETMSIAHRQRGFSLIEAVITSSIALLISLVLYVLMKSNADSMSVTTQKLRLQAIGDIVQREIQISARNSDKVFSPAAYQSYVTTPTVPGDGTPSATVVFLLSPIPQPARIGGKWRAMRVNSGRLEIDSGGNSTGILPGNWLPFLVGGSEVYIHNPTPFVMPSNLNWETLQTDLQQIRLQPASANSIAVDPMRTITTYH